MGNKWTNECDLNSQCGGGSCGLSNVSINGKCVEYVRESVSIIKAIYWGSDVPYGWRSVCFPYSSLSPKNQRKVACLSPGHRQ